MGVWKLWRFRWARHEFCALIVGESRAPRNSVTIADTNVQPTSVSGMNECPLRPLEESPIEPSSFPFSAVADLLRLNIGERPIH